MVLAQDLRDAVLQTALQGKLTKQLETDSSVDELLNKIQTKRKSLILEKKIKKVSIKPIQMNDVPFEIPVNWKWQRIGSFEEINLGFTYRPQYVTKGVYFLSVKDISNGKIDFSNAKKVSKETYDNASYGSKPQKGDILFGRVCTMGKPQIIETDVPFCIFVSLGFFREHTNLMNKEYISYWMQSPLFYKQVNENVKGAAQKNLNTGWLKDFFIPIPPIEEQQRIVDKINELMEKIDEYEEVEKALLALEQRFPDDMKNALLQAAMQGKLTEQLDSDNSVDEMLENEDICLFDMDDYPYTIPRSWKFAKMEELTAIPVKRGKSPKYVDKSKILVFAQKCNQKMGGISLQDAKYLDESVKNKYKEENYLKGNDIVINSTGGGTLGRIGYITEDLINNSLPIVPDSHVTTIRAKKNILSKYIFFFLKFNQSYLESMGVGSTNQTELKPDTIKELLVPVPPLEEQQRIVERLEQLLPLCETL